MAVKLSDTDRLQALKLLEEKIERAIGESPKGLTREDLQECWHNALTFWNYPVEGR